jgi:hypothetical protein
MGPGWVFPLQAPNRFVVARDRFGNELHFMENWRQSGKMRISAHVPFPYYREIPSINVSMSRSPQAIAGEVRRRIIPEFREAYKKAKQEHEQHHKRRVSAIHSALAVYGALGNRFRCGNKQLERTGDIRVHPLLFGVRALEIDSDYHTGEPSCTLTIKLDTVSACRLIRYLRVIEKLKK